MNKAYFKNLAKFLIMSAVLVPAFSLFAEEVSPFSLASSLGHSSNFYKMSSPDNISSTEVGLSSGYRTSPRSSVSFESSFSYQLRDGGLYDERTSYKNYSFSDSTLASSYTFYKDSSLAVNGLLGSMIPTSSESREERELKTSLYVGAAVSDDLEFINISSMTAKLTTIVGKNFHKYTTTVSGSALPSTYLKNSLGISYDVGHGVALGYKLTITNSWTYRGARQNTRYANLISADYEVNERWSTSLAISDTDNMYKANGLDNNWKMIDRDNKNTTVMAQVGYRFF